jgi:hypothetical protein
VVWIEDKAFTIDCYGLALGSFNMVLGVQWLECLGPILWDFSQRTLAFVRDGHHILWMTDPVGASPSTAFTVSSSDIMDDLLA